MPYLPAGTASIVAIASRPPPSIRVSVVPRFGARATCGSEALSFGPGAISTRALRRRSIREPAFSSPARST